jgi:hypothetical protein
MRSQACSDLLYEDCVVTSHRLGLADYRLIYNAIDVEDGDRHCLSVRVQHI